MKFKWVENYKSQLTGLNDVGVTDADESVPGETEKESDESERESITMSLLLAPTERLAFNVLDNTRPGEEVLKLISLCGRHSRQARTFAQGTLNEGDGTVQLTSLS
jgi:hypothetical protein